MKKLRFIFALLFIAIAMQALADLGPLIPRDVLFGNPERANPRISPDGKRLAWLAPDQKNVLQVWVRTIGQNDDKVVTADKKRGIRQYNWASDNKTLLYLQDNDGDENFHVYGVDLASGIVRDSRRFRDHGHRSKRWSPAFLIRCSSRSMRATGICSTFTA